MRLVECCPATKRKTGSYGKCGAIVSCAFAILLHLGGVDGGAHEIAMADDAFCLLSHELDIWHRAGLMARFWLRDDDACDVTPELLSLEKLATRYDIEVGLAVIVAQLSPALAERISGEGQPFYPMCHGWMHRNHSLNGKPAEFGSDRLFADLYTDAALAQARFREHFPNLSPIFVPPFGVIAPELAKALPELGFYALSNGPGRHQMRVARALARLSVTPTLPRGSQQHCGSLEVHVDPINWRTKTCQSRSEIVRQCVAELRLRRVGFRKAGSLIGILTHHLIHDPSIWSVCDELIRFLRGHKAVVFPRLRLFLPPLQQ